MNTFLTFLFIFFSLCVVDSQNTTMNLIGSNNDGYLKIGAQSITFQFFLYNPKINNNAVIQVVVPPEFVLVGDLVCKVDALSANSSNCQSQTTNNLHIWASSYNTTIISFTLQVYNHIGISNKTQNFSVTVMGDTYTYTLSQEISMTPNNLASNFIYLFI